MRHHHYWFFRPVLYHLQISPDTTHQCFSSQLYTMRTERVPELCPVAHQRSSHPHPQQIRVLGGGGGRLQWLWRTSYTLLINSKRWWNFDRFFSSSIISCRRSSTRTYLCNTTPRVFGCSGRDAESTYQSGVGGAGGEVGGGCFCQSKESNSQLLDPKCSVLASHAVTWTPRLIIRMTSSGDS